ncbi:Dedicator of cytokinesis protein 3 [Collichthys lucidus]|uniref:Dedicator of cytokinesis protein 3 n=1 Tax=Collichthys lucidus TaxID=240159 RepID=A0A4U5VQQ9_COLLU|nr:Dedicator of cytokinesis protein 3 [Collichthys lucidus]
MYACTRTGHVHSGTPLQSHLFAAVDFLSSSGNASVFTSACVRAAHCDLSEGLLLLVRPFLGCYLRTHNGSERNLAVRQWRRRNESRSSWVILPGPGFCLHRLSVLYASHTCVFCLFLRSTNFKFSSRPSQRLSDVSLLLSDPCCSPLCFKMHVLASFRGTVQHGLPLEIGDTVQILEKCEGTMHTLILKRNNLCMHPETLLGPNKHMQGDLHQVQCVHLPDITPLVRLLEGYRSAAFALSWYRGFILKNPNIKGIFPSSYIHLKNAHVKNKGQFETVIPVEDSVITEMTSTLRDWGAMWKQLYVKNEGDLFHRLWHVMNEILDLRRQVLVGHLTHDRMRDVKQHITARLDWGNEQLCLDLVPRREFSMVDPDEISVTELYRLVSVSSQSNSSFRQHGGKMQGVNQLLTASSKPLQTAHSSTDRSRQLTGQDVLPLSVLCLTRLTSKMEHRHRKKETPTPASTHHLFVHMKSLMSANLGEELEVFFHIYDGRENRPLRQLRFEDPNFEAFSPVPSVQALDALDTVSNLHSVPVSSGLDAVVYDDTQPSLFTSFISIERFFVKLNKSGLPKSPEKTERQCTLFVDLGSSDLRKDVYIVVHIIRIGRMGAGEKKNLCSVQYRRPFGCAVVSIADLLTADSKDDHLLKVYACNTESEWFQIHENIIKKANSRYNLSGSNTGLAVALQLLHGDIEQLRREYMVLFTRGVSITRKLGFSDVIMPGEMRNDLYITLEKGEFEKGGKSVARNVEITVYVLDIDGQVLKSHVAAGSGEPGGDEYHSLVLYHNNSPRWAEQIKLPIPVDMFRGSHVRFEFRHCSSEWDQYRAYTIHLTKINTLFRAITYFQAFAVEMRTPQHSSCWCILDLSVMSMCCCCLTAKDKGEKKLFGYSFVPLMQEDGRTLPDGTHELIIHKCEENTSLADCSRYLKQPFSKANLPSNNQTLKGTKESFWITSFLCSTKLTQNGDMLDLLKWRAHPERINDSLSKLKEIDGSEIVKFLQDTLDTLFGILDESSQRYGLKVFDSLHFADKSASLKMKLYSVLRPYHQPPPGQQIPALQARHGHLHREPLRRSFVLQASEYIFKYIIQSRRLFSLATRGQNEEEFRVCIHELFMSIRFFLSQENKGTSPVAQTQAVFLRTFPAIYGELLKIFTVREVAGFVRETLGSLPTTIHADCPLEAVKLQCIAKTVESQLYINPGRVCGVLVGPFATDERQTLPAAAAGVQQQRQPEETFEFQSDALSDISDVHARIQMFHTAYVELYRKDFLLQIFTVFRILIRPEMFPKDWTVMRLVTNNVIITTVLYLSDALRKNFLNDKFDYKVWDSYFYLSVIFINQPCLQLESFSPSKRKKILENKHTSNRHILSCRYGDMRVMMGCEIFSMWQNLGEHKLNFIPAMIGPFLEVTLVPQPDLRNVMIPIFHDMMDWEQRRSGNFKQVEAKLIDKLDSLMSEGKGDETYRELFNSILLKKIERETWRESGISLIATVTRLMERLLDYRDCMKLGEVDGKKIGCTVSLLNFYKTELNKEEMYIRYIHKLYDLHLKAQNYTEASYTLLLYDELLEWSDRPLREFLNYPMQSEWQRKEYLHLTIVQNFDRGKGKVALWKPSKNYTCRKKEKRNLSSIPDEITQLYGIIKTAPLVTHSPISFTFTSYAICQRCRTGISRQQERKAFHLISKMAGCCMYLHEECWENGIILCRELADQYESYYDYRNLSKMRMMEASLYDKIMDQQRLEPEFFRVGFYGKKFPFFLRNKEFVCRGHDYERLEAFQQRMLNEFPHAIAMQHVNQPDQTIYQADAQCILGYSREAHAKFIHTGAWTRGIHAEQTQPHCFLLSLSLSLFPFLLNSRLLPDLQIYAVTPIPESQDVLQRDGVPDNIKSFYKFNHIWRFRYDRPFHKGTKDKENEFKSCSGGFLGLKKQKINKGQLGCVVSRKTLLQPVDIGSMPHSLWVERTTLTLVQSLPGISRWFEVDKRELVEVSPLENAIEVIENKNLQLRTLITQCQSRQMQNINPLTMCLNGVIDAAVNGGLARYQEAFFVKDYIMNHPEDGDKIGRLRELMFEQAHILEYGLAVHEKFVPQDMRPLHKKLVDQFHLMKSSLGIQEFPAYVRASPVHFTNGSPRTCRNSVPNIISPDGGRGVARRSPLSYPAVNRYSSSSLSSQASNEVSNITGQSESSDEVFNMQPSPSTSSLSSNHSASPNVTSSAPSSARGSPQMAEKHKHSRENACLSPRERPVSAIFPNPLDPAQTTVPPFTPSPTECQSTSLVSNSPVLSGSYSSGISSLSRCSVSEASGTELPTGEHPPHPLPPPTTLPNSVSSGSDEPIRRENKTPPPYSVYERNNPRRPVPLPHSLSIPPQTDPPALPPKPHQLRTGSMKLDGTSDPRVPRPRPLPRKVSQL